MWLHSPSCLVHPFLTETKVRYQEAITRTLEHNPQVLLQATPTYSQSYWQGALLRALHQWPHQQQVEEAQATSFTTSLVTTPQDSTLLWLHPAQRAAVWTIQVLLSRLHCRFLPLRYLLFSSFFKKTKNKKKDRLISQSVIWTQYSKAKRMLKWKPKHLVGNCSCRLMI